MSNLTNAVQTILDKREGYEQAENYYDGTVDEIYATPAVKKALRKTGDHFRVNFAATPVHAVANRLEITSVAGVSKNAEKVIDNIWTTNELELEVNYVHNRALVYGDAYLFVWAIDGELEMYYNSPKTTVVVYDSENPRLPAYAAKMWQVENEDGEERVRVNLYYTDRIEKYISIGERLPMSVKDDTFEEYVDEDTDSNGVMENPFGIIPIFHFRTNRPFGKPEHVAAYGPQDMINKILITQMASVEHYGFPTRYILAGEHSEGAPDDFDDDEPDNDHMSSEPGDEWWLKNVDKVGQFDAAKPGTYLEPYREYIRSMASVTETPLHYFENTHTNVSGESLRAAEAPLVKKVRTRQLSFGSTWREVFKMILKSFGLDEDVQIHWKSIESIDEKEKWEVNYKKVQAGLPESQMLLEAGYDAALVAKWEEEKAKRALEAQNGPNTTPNSDGPDGKNVIEDVPSNTDD